MVRKSLAESVLPIMRGLRPLLFPAYGKAEMLAQKSESVHDVVTKYDHAAEEHIAFSLKKLFPTIGFVGEERGGDRTAGRFWLCDPIDGTFAFLHGNVGCTSMLALIAEGQPVFGVIYDFVNDIMYHADKGKGAYANGELTYVSCRPATEGRVAFETNIKKPENYETYLRVKANVSVHDASTSGSDYALVATGKLDGRIALGSWGKDYDYAPGAILVSEAGGIVANVGSKSYDYRNTSIIAAAPQMYRALTSGKDSAFPVE